jgi:hypothetical protein
MEVRAMDVPRKDEPQRELGRHRKLAIAEYELLRLLSNVLGEIFWAIDQKKCKLADQLEQLEDWQVPDDQFLIDHESRISSE